MKAQSTDVTSTKKCRSLGYPQPGGTCRAPAWDWFFTGYNLFASLADFAAGRPDSGMHHSRLEGIRLHPMYRSVDSTDHRQTTSAIPSARTVPDSVPTGPKTQLLISKRTVLN